MPFVEGETLRDRLQRENQLPVDDAVRIATRGRATRSTTRTARRGASRHQAGEHPAARRPRAGRRLRHRAGGRAGGRRAHDADGHLARHAAYMAPEQAMGERSVDARSRHLRAGRVTVRDARRRAAVHRSDRAGDSGAGDHGRTAVARSAAQECSRVRGCCGPHRAGEAPRRSVREREGFRGGARAPCRCVARASRRSDGRPAPAAMVGTGTGLCGAHFDSRRCLCAWHASPRSLRRT